MNSSRGEGEIMSWGEEVEKLPGADNGEASELGEW